MSPSSKGRVLIVDDNASNLKLLATYLRAEHYEPISADNGSDALVLARKEDPDVILLDIMMPGMDGYEVTRELKNDPRTAQIPIVLVTALDGVEDRVKGLESGADDFISKPFNRAELLARVRTLQRLKIIEDELRHRMALTVQLTSQLSCDDESTDSVLIVEDDPSLSRHLNLILTNKGYKTYIAESASDARTKLAECYPTVILMDLMLPDANGMDFISELKRAPLTQDIPILVLTSVDDVDTKVQAIEYGADDYLTKPIDSSELMARIRATLRRVKAHRKLKTDMEQLVVNALVDPLTGVNNRRFLEAEVGRRIAVASRYSNRSFSLILADVDHFKQVNDTYGHAIGDVVLKQVANLMKESLRGGDVVARYGGEEFAVVLPETDQQGAMELAERIRRDFDKPLNINEDLPELTISISFGVAQWEPHDEEFVDILRRADRALYRAKEAGRNCVVAAD